jgi:hypothetical protein
MGISYNTSIVTDGLVFALDAANPRCYSGSGTSVSTLVGGMGGTFYGGSGFTNSNSGSFVFYDNILKFSGKDIFDSVYTQCAWFRMNVLQPSLIMDGGYAGTVAYNGRIAFYYKDSSPFYMNAFVTLATSRWYYVCSVRGATQKQIYLDTVLLASVNDSDMYSCPYDYIQIGKNATIDPLNGNISQVHVYNRALSQQEIIQNYNATKGRYI